MSEKQLQIRIDTESPTMMKKKEEEGTAMEENQKILVNNIWGLIKYNRLCTAPCTTGWITPLKEQEIEAYEKKVKELEHEVTILQLKVSELEAKDTSHLACKVEAQSLRREKEAAEALAAAYKTQLMLANELIKSRIPSEGSGKKRRGGSEEEEGSDSKRQKA